MSIEELFYEYLKVTGDDKVAASNLVLASVFSKPARAALTVKQAAEQLNVSPGTIYDLCESGRLKHRRIGTGRGTIRISADDLKVLDKNNRCQTRLVI